LESAARSNFIDTGNSRQFYLNLPGQQPPPGLVFVLYQTREKKWINYRNENFFVPLDKTLPNKNNTSEDTPSHHQVDIAALTQEIVAHEIGNQSWTLMHRYKLCLQLLEREGFTLSFLSLSYVWLRYSFLRQLDWQRSYNTPPRELAHAVDCLSHRLSDNYQSVGEEGLMIRLMLSTLGRGGDGQRVRDDILRIIHKNHLKEQSGHFIEEWHQKLHNNTTPDDVVICQAYLAFMKNNGDLNQYTQVLQEGGLTREALAGYDRPIVNDPEYYPELNNSLIEDFTQFLQLLKGVHCGIDLATAIQSARHLLDLESGGLIAQIWQNRDNQLVVVEMLGFICIVRQRLKNRMETHQHCSEVRDLLFLDIALQEHFRAMIERFVTVLDVEEQLMRSMALALENMALTISDPEITMCVAHWKRMLLCTDLRKQKGLRALAILQQVSRVLSNITQRVCDLLQPLAIELGRGCRVENWCIDIFSEEVCRGMPMYPVSLLVTRLLPELRKWAKVGDWQIVSRATAYGRVRRLGSLQEIGKQPCNEPLILLLDKTDGSEELLEGAVAIITGATVDILSHVAIRARNAAILFATCYSPEKFKQLADLEGKMVVLTPSNSGEIRFEEGEQKVSHPPSLKSLSALALELPSFQFWLVGENQFQTQLVGGKSRGLSILRSSLTENATLPESWVIPFGVFEKVLEEPFNRQINIAYYQQQEHLLVNTQNYPEKLSLLRELIMQLEIPEQLRMNLQQSGMVPDQPWVYNCIKQVWASKWNDRAYLNRNSFAISHRNLSMAVLIQRVVNADFSFVLHTCNPLSGKNDELYGEIVPGLGETLVGNHPGTALGFVYRKKSRTLCLISFPSKSQALVMQGEGIIFRSDSNGEDLPEYAGAGLYDSVIYPQPQPVLLDYSTHLLLWNKIYREQLLRSIIRVGLQVAKKMGSAQDIEGAVIGSQIYILQSRKQVGLAASD